ncbi:MAG: hypothetical protein J7M29_01265 [Verrucomicrobia bacterium]|nr:hypothetical protein [Verrucomicrobiota bacterium]
MRQFLSVLFVALLAWGIWAFYRFAKESMAKAPETQADVSMQPAPGKLPGMAAALEPSLEQARKEGADGLRRWLIQHRGEVQDPRLAEIEMDYAVLMGSSDPQEAKRVLDAVGRRITPDSPVYERYQKLRKVYP